MGGSYRDPTYIHLLFYFIDRMNDLVEDFNALAGAMKVEPLTLDGVRAKVDELLSSSDRRRDLIRHAPPFAVELHAFPGQNRPDTCIVQIVHAPGKDVSDPRAGWGVASTVPWSEARRALGRSIVFAVNSTARDGRALRDLRPVVREVSRPAVLPVSPVGYGRADLGFGVIEHLWDDVFLLVLKHQDPMPDPAVDFQCDLFPQLEMLRHKARHYATLLSEGLDLIRRAIDGGYDPRRVARLLRGESNDDAVATLRWLESVRFTVEASLQECRTIQGNIRDAREGYRRILRAFGLRPRQPLWRNLLLSLDPLLQEDYVRHCEGKVGQVKEAITRLSAVTAPPSPPVWPRSDEMAAFFDADDLLYRHFLDCKEHWDVWHFTRVPEMVRHDRPHAENVYRILAKLMRVLQERNLLPRFNPIELYCLVNAVFLHDIGLSGGIVPDDEGRPVPLRDYYPVRRLHGRIAQHKLCGPGEVAVYRLAAGAGQPVGLLCAYHQREAPIHESWGPWSESVHVMGRPHTFTLRVLPADRLHVGLKLPNGRERQGTVRLRPLAALLRLADALDVNRKRAGDWQFRKAVEEARRLEIEAELSFLRSHGVRLDEFRGDLLNVEAAPKERLEGIADALKGLENLYADPAVKRSLHYLAYLAKQPLHFRKHLCFDDVELQIEEGAGGFRLLARYRRTEEAVDDTPVREALETVRADLQDELSRIRAIEPFDRIREIEVSEAGSAR
jgi:hypothetical protein